MSEKEEIGKDVFQKLLVEKGFVFNKTVVEEIEIDFKKLNLTRNQFDFNDIVFKEKITLKNYEHPCKIFTSYAWGGESERIAEGVEKGLEIIREFLRLWEVKFLGINKV